MSDFARDFEDLGEANHWREKPAVVIACRQAKHLVTDRRDERIPFLHTVICARCKYTYTYDSSD